MPEQVVETKSIEIKNPEIKPEAWAQIALERMEKLTAAKVRTEQLEAENTKYRAAEQERQAKDAERQQEAEKSKLEGEGKYQEALKLQQEASTKSLSEVKSRARKKIIPNLIKGILINCSIIPTAVDDVSNYLESRISLDDNYDPFVIGDDGKPMLDDKTMTPIPADKFITGYIEGRSWLKGDKMVIGTGTQPGNKGSIVSNPTWTPENAFKSRALAEEWKKADPVGYETAMETYQRNYGKK